MACDRAVSYTHLETMAYRHVGCGENKVILIHGFQSSSQFFEDLLEGLDENIEVFAPDLIGYGESSYENKHKEMKEWAEDLKDVYKRQDKDIISHIFMVIKKITEDLNVAEDGYRIVKMCIRDSS